MKFFSALIVLLAISLTAMAQNANETVYFKNGNIIKCTVIEQIPNETIKIMTSDGSIFVYNMSDVIKITKELTNNDANSKFSAFSMASNGEILSTLNNKLYLGTTKLSSEEALQLLGEDTYKTFRSACRLVWAGNTLLLIGVVMIVPTIALYATELTYFLASFAVSNIGLCLGSVLRGCGNRRKDWVIDSYNNQVRSYSFNITPAILHTPSSASNLNQYAMGASLRISF